MKNNVRFLKHALALGVTLAVLALVPPGLGETQAGAKTAKAKPYPLKTCLVSGEKLDGGMGKPYVFVYQGQEFKFCCPVCKREFDKNPAKFVKKLADEVKKTKAAQK
jgi:YHS domain-containing protein